MSFAVIAAVATIAGTVTNVYGSIQAGKAAEDAAKEQARQEKIQAESEELARREELNKQLAAQNAAMAASGVATEGTPASIALESAKSISQSEGMISLSGKLARAQTIRSGQAAKAAAYTKATSTLLSSGEDLYNAGKTIKDKWNKPKEGKEGGE